MKKDTIDGDRIIIYDNSGEQSTILKRIIIKNQNGESEYRLRKTKKQKYLMEK